MRRKRRNRVIIAWLLLLALMPITFVKATHFHESDNGVVTAQSSLPGHSHGGDSGNSCPICNFVLSPFVVVPSIHLSFFEQSFSVLFHRVTYKVKQTKVLHHYLRAPPSSIVSLF